MARQLGGTIGLALVIASFGCDDGGGGRGAGAGYFPGGGVGADSQDEGGADEGEDTEDDGSEDTDGGDGTGGGDDNDGGGDGAPKFDTPNGSAGEVPEPTYGCAKVDFVFVIDSSGSMVDEQDNLLASFPGFISAIEGALMNDDFHIMVVDAGPVLGFGCEAALGAGQIRSAAGQDCGLGGKRYATKDTPDLVSAFSCMASRGYEGSPNEVTMDALIHSVTVENGAGACNEGFLRDDALLVATVITDEEDDALDGIIGDPPLDGSCVPADSDFNSLGSPDTWRQALVDAKGGDPEAVVMLGLFGDCDVGGSCPGMTHNPGAVQEFTGAEPAPRLRAFANSFTYGSVGPVCAVDYSPFFAEAVSVIDTACDNFEPPG